MATLSLRLKLPLWICGLLLVVLAGLSWTVYRESRRTALGVANARLTQVARQFGELLDQSGRQLAEQARALAADPSIREYLRQPTAAARAEALSTLERRHLQNQNVVAMEVWDASGRRLLTTREYPSMGPARVAALLAVAQPGEGVVGRIDTAGDSLSYATVGTLSEGGRVRGYVVERRRLAASPQVTRQLSELIGSNSRLLLGNTDGSLWTDWGRPVEPPASALPTSGPVTLTRNDGERVLVVARPIATSPWTVLVEFPESAALGPVHALLGRIALLAAAFLVIGGLGAWWLSAQITRPLRQLTGASAAVAAGDFATRVDVRRHDELGQLAAAFAAMADQIAASQHDLEAKVDTRTRQLQESRGTLQTVLDNMADGVVVAGLDGRFTLWNRAAERITGLGMTDTNPAEWPETYGVFRPDGVTPYPPDQLPLVRALRGESTDDDEQLIRNAHRPEGVHVSVSGRPLVDAEGRRRGGVVVFRDVTERRRAEQARLASEARFRTLVESAHDAIVLAGPDGCITYVNPAAERIFGYAGVEAVGRPLTLLMPERFHEPHRRGFARYLETREARVVGRTVPLVGRRKDGSEFPLELSLAAWEGSAGTSFTGIIRDITERVRLEEDVRRNAEQLAAANQELESFSYSVSHDLRAPLRAVHGFAQILSEDHAAKLGKEGRRVLGVIGDNVRRMGQLIDDLLAFSRTGRKEIEPVSVNMRGLAQAALDDLRRGEAGTNVEVSIADLPAARGDPALLRQVWANLISNALKFSRTRERPRVEIGARRDGSHGAVYFVRDNGVGFDPRFADKLFGVFQRLHRQEDFEGTGVGLAIVQRVIHRHGGRVWAEAEPDRGATFSFSLPEL